MTPTVSGLFEVSPGEFLISVQVFVNSTPTVLHKPPAKNRKLDKRESVADDLRTKGLAEHKGSTITGHWRDATCRLTEDKERCTLYIDTDDNATSHSILVHLLNQTDIRSTEQSLFFRKDCISVMPRVGQLLMPSNTAQPIHIAFPSPDTRATWLALLKSYALPETYGNDLAPLEGGFYRLWRQVDLTVIQGRNLCPPNGNPRGREERSDSDVYCEIYLNDMLCSRTTVKEGLGSTEWHEQFLFPGLPPFEKLEIVVRKESTSKQTNLGSTSIVLSNFRRGEFVEGWFPVVRQIEALGIENRIGDLRLKIQVDEEVILPNSCYTRLMDSFKSRNFLDLISDLERHSKSKGVSRHIMLIAIANNTFVQQIQDYVTHEVESSPTSHQTLFRGNTKFTKIVELSMTWYGMPFLEASIGPVLRRLCSEKVAIAIDSLRGGKIQKHVEKNVEQLIFWCREIWNQIYSVRGECPNEMRAIFYTVRKVVEERCPAESGTGTADSQKYLPWQCVSAFVFLRFIVPAILHPHLFGLHPGLLSAPVQRSLTLIAKVIQSLANLNVASYEKNFIWGVQEFLNGSFHGMIDYITIVSTPVTDVKPVDSKTRHVRRVANDLRQRTRTMPALHRESIPALPHLLDVPGHLACISSVIVRNSKESPARWLGDNVDPAVDEFRARCLEIEEEALARVKRIPSMALPESSNTVIHSDSRKQLYSGPVIAPSLTGDETHRQIEEGEHANTEGPSHVGQWDVHQKSSSTDSLSNTVREARTSTYLPSATPTTEKDDTGKWKSALFRGILK